MAIKHVKQYYAQVCDQAERMTKTLEQISEYSQDHMISPANMNALQQQVNAIKANKARLDYIMYLLYLPNRDEKKKAYDLRNKKAIANLEKNAEVTENEECLDNISSLMNEDE